MTLDRTPTDASVILMGKTGQCAAYGCPMWAGIKVGSAWVCECHAFADVTEWEQVTLRLNQRIAIVRASHRAMNTDPFKRWTRAAVRCMTRVGRRDLIPGEVVMAYRHKDRDTGEFLERTIKRDECQHLPLWASRIRTALFRECVHGISQAHQPTAKAGRQQLIETPITEHL